MPRPAQKLLPSTERYLTRLGARIRSHRKTQRITSTLLAERTGLTRNTLRAVEAGNPNVSIGSYLQVLESLSLATSMENLAPVQQLLDDAVYRRRTVVLRTKKARDANS